MILSVLYAGQKLTASASTVPENDFAMTVLSHRIPI